MARILFRLFFVALVVVSFSFFAHGIVNAKTLQLRIEVSRKQLLNYRLSSELLRSRLRLLFQQEQDFSGEIRMSVLESSVMNSDLSELPLHVDALAHGGIAATNVVRLMNLKPVLHIDADRRALLLLQYAFFLERKKRFPEAVLRYLQVMPLLFQEEDRAFAHLHLGYCLTLLGREAEALRNLETVVRTHDGRHFGDAATELIVVIRENTARQTAIRVRHRTPEGRAQALFESGQYRRALVEMESVSTPSPRMRLLRARSLEETGRVAEAASAYRGISESADERVRRQAVRRLLLLGEFLSADPEMRSYARREAARVGDGQVVQEIQEARSMLRAPILLVKLGRAKTTSAEPPGGEAALVAELRTLFPQERFVRALPKVTRAGDRVIFVEPPEVRASSASVADRRTVEPPPAAALAARPPTPEPRRAAPATEEPGGSAEAALSPSIRAKARLEIRFVDGRTLPAEHITLADGLLKIGLAQSTVALPFSIVAEIRLTRAHAGQNMSVRFPGGPEERVTRLRRDGPGGFRLLAPDGAETARLGTPEEIRLR